MRSMKRLLAMFGVLAATMMMSAGAAASDAPVLDRILKNGEIRVGMSGNQPPFNARSRQGGLIGLEVDLANQLAAAMGVKLKIVNKPFGDLLATLDKGDVDIVMSGVGITAGRSARYAFAGPYVMSGKSILTKSSTLAAAKSADEINKADVRFAALENSTRTTTTASRWCSTARSRRWSRTCRSACYRSSVIRIRAWRRCRGR